jgi:hypothetical protein
MLCAARSKLQAQDFFPQQTNYGLRVGIGYELPGNNIIPNFNPALNYSLSIVKYIDPFTIEAGVFYRQFQVKPGINNALYAAGMNTLAPYASYMLMWAAPIITS